jgi:hypothetical protein
MGLASRSGRDRRHDGNHGCANVAEGSANDAVLEGRISAMTARPAVVV